MNLRQEKGNRPTRAGKRRRGRKPGLGYAGNFLFGLMNHLRRFRTGRRTEENRKKGGKLAEHDIGANCGGGPISWLGTLSNDATRAPEERRRLLGNNLQGDEKGQQ